MLTHHFRMSLPPLKFIIPDYNVGIVLDAIDAAGVAKNTVVVLTGDHGWQLGEHGEWCKRTNFEVGVRIPLMIRSPAHVSLICGG